jgi:hypothetical protein
VVQTLSYKLPRMLNTPLCAEIMDDNSTQLFLGEMPIGGAVTLQMF